MLNGAERQFDRWQQELSELIREPENRHLIAAMEDGRVPIGYTCSYVPRTILSVDNLLPVRMRAPVVEGTEIADIYLSNVLCSYSRSLLESAMDRRFDFLGGWVFAAGCDHIRRLLDNLTYLNETDFTHIIDAPHRYGKEALRWYREELAVLCRKLEEKFGVDAGMNELEKAISRQNAFHAVLSEISGFRKRKNPPISGTAFQRIMIASLVSDREKMFDDLESAVEELRGRPGMRDYRARLMIVGGNIDDTEFIETIESSGGLVVADRFCTGSLPGIEVIESRDDPLTDIARHTLSRTACPRMMEGYENRLDDILRIRESYQADGVVIENIKFCDIWGIETGLLADGLKKAGVPVLRLERSYRSADEGQLRTRIQAFLERLEK